MDNVLDRMTELLRLEETSKIIFYGKRERFSVFDIYTDRETHEVSFSKADELQDSSHYLAPEGEQLHPKVIHKPSVTVQRGTDLRIFTHNSGAIFKHLVVASTLDLII